MDSKSFIMLSYLNQGIVPLAAIVENPAMSIDDFLPNDHDAARKSKRKFRKLKRKARKLFLNEKNVGKGSKFDVNQRLVEIHMMENIIPAEFPHLGFLRYFVSSF